MSSGGGDANYFSAYSDIGVHELMLRDEPRTRAYQLFIERNQSLFKDKIVIDVGAGTGVLSLFAAKAGAKKVYAIEGSDMAFLCKEIVHGNGFEDTIEIIHSLVEEAILPITKGGADVILSEWMGFYLLHEAMISSVIYARDKWLKQSGLMMPAEATIYMCPVTMKEYIKQNLNCWDNMYGLNFEPIKKCLMKKNASQPLIENLSSAQQLADPVMVAHFHLQYVAMEDLFKIHRNLNFTLTKYGICHGFACWFDCSFNDSDSIANSEIYNSLQLDAKPVLLSTAPGAPATHWKQTVIMLPEPLMVNKDEDIACKLDLLQDTENLRRYNISIEIEDEESEEEEEEDVASLVQNVDDDFVKDKLLQLLK